MLRIVISDQQTTWDRDVSSTTLDDNAAVLAPVLDNFASFRRHFFELVLLDSRRVKTFRTVTLCQVVLRDCQMTMAAAQSFLRLRQ